MYIIKDTGDPDFPFIALDSQSNVHTYTAKGRYTKTFGNHPLHLNHEIKQDYKRLFYAMNGKQ